MRRFLLSLLLLPALVSGAAAQSTALQPASASDAQQTVTLGNATVPLTGPWKFHIGDNMAWAQPDFDDSAWSTLDLTPPPGSYDPTFGSSGFVPGWTARGYKGYHGYAWYRLRVNLQDGQTALALKMPNDFDDAYQVYVNGQFVGEFGRFTQHGVTYYESKPRAFPLPGDIRNGSVTIAIRMWMATATPLRRTDAGGLHGPPILGQISVVQALLGMYWQTLDHRESSIVLSIAINLLALLIAFGLYWLDRNEPAYLWLGLKSVVGVFYVIVLLLAIYTTWISAPSTGLLLRAVGEPVADGLEVLFWAYWFRIGRLRRLHCSVWGIVLLLGVGAAMLQAPLYGRTVPVHAIVWLSPLTLVLKLLLGVLLIWVTYQGIRRDRIEGWLALPAVLLAAVSMYWAKLVALHLLAYFFLFGVFFPLGLVTNYVSLAIILVLLLRRFLRTQREREQWKLEIEQARQVQQMLIPEALPVVPGFTLESEYRPAQQVGGDFFQIIEGNDGSILIVLGDVSGKGLKAAMLVSLMVGAIRMAVEALREPMPILEALNRRLCGRMEGHFATCLVARIAPDGSVALANAGHLPPYLNGNEIAIAGSLPLGIVEDAKFEAACFTLQPTDRLTLLTDGVLEATNSNRELFGFARVDAAMRGEKSAAEIAAEAQAFGQLDDITVVRVTRSATPVVQIAEDPAFVAG